MDQRRAYDDADLARLFDEQAGAVSAEIYSDRALYDLELERVFSRSWLVVAHATQVPKPGDFLTSYMAEDPVIVVRQKDGGIRVLLNQCRHRGMKICRLDQGNAKAFTCSYHGWAYDTAGALVNVPLEEKAFPGFDKSQWGARQARVEIYKGLVFATWNEQAPSVVEYLGDIAYYLDAILDRSEGGTEAIGGIIKWVIPCNWKLAAEQFASDLYHGIFSHTSPQIVAANRAGRTMGTGVPIPSRQFRSSRGGHGTGFYLSELQGQFRVSQAAEAVPGFDPSAARNRTLAHAGDAVADIHAQHITIFPNFSVFAGLDTARIWHPRGPDQIEVWAFGLADVAATPEEKEQIRIATLRTFSPAGTWEQDDGENWVEIQRVLKGREARRTQLNIQMGIGRPAGGDPRYPMALDTGFAEEAARGLYAHWLKLMRDVDGVQTRREAYADAAE